MNNIIMRGIALMIALLLPWTVWAQRSAKLTGEVIGTTLSVDYTTNRQSTTVNTRECAFDGDLTTYFASYDRSLTWVGLDLGAPHLITGVAWSPRDDSNGPRRVQLAVFEGANRPDFLDAVPLYIVSEAGTIGQLSYDDVEVTRAFRYVRYVGPNDARCNVAEVVFYGDAAETAEATTDAEENNTSSDAEDGSDAPKEQLYQLTNLPTVTIHVADNREPSSKTTELVAYVSIISKEGKKVLYDTCSIRLRGNKSKEFPKKPYRIKFDQKHHVLGSPAKAKKWTLINNYGDKTLMRNILAFELSRRMGMAYTPFCQPVDVIVNGEYKGCYQLCDQVEVHKDRVEIEEMDPRCTSGEALTGGYFIEADAYAYDEPSYFYSSHSNPITIKSPDSDSILSIQKSYVQSRFNSLESALFGSNYKDTDKGYRRYLDLESFLRHFIVGEYSGNTDTYWSTYFYKPRGEEQFFTGPVWDFDLAFENDNRTYPVCSQSDYIYASKGSFAGEMRYFVSRIVKSDNTAFQRLKEIWEELRLSHAMDLDSLQAFVDDQAELLDASQKLNFMRWNIMNSYVHQNPKVWGSYSAEVRNVRDFLQRRMTWMDRKLGFDPERLAIESPRYDAMAEEPIYDLMGRKREALQQGMNVQGRRIILVK